MGESAAALGAAEPLDPCSGFCRHRPGYYLPVVPADWKETIARTSERATQLLDHPLLRAGQLASHFLEPALVSRELLE